MPAAEQEAAPTHHTNASAAYTLPNDDTEHARLEQQSHALNTLMKGKPFQAPVAGWPITGNIIDIGCGTGGMTVRLAREHPSAQVYGVDLTAIPPVHQKPENVKYVVGNVRELLPGAPNARFEPDHFAYAFSRYLVLGMTDWPGYMAQLFSLLAPGDWAELQEPELTWRDAKGEDVSQGWTWFHTMNNVVSKKGVDMQCAGKVEGWMQDAGFVDVQVRTYMQSWSSQPRPEHPESEEIGRYHVDVLRKQMQRVNSNVLVKSGRTAEEIEEFGEEVLRTLDMSAGGHVVYYVVWGRKPGGV